MKPTCAVCGTTTNVCKSAVLGVLCGSCLLWCVFEFHKFGRSVA
jgi:hypothetical protein